MSTAQGMIDLQKAQRFFYVNGDSWIQSIHDEEMNVHESPVILIADMLVSEMEQYSWYSEEIQDELICLAQDYIKIWKKNNHQ